MVQSLVSQMVVGIAGIWLATQFVPGVAFNGTWQVLVVTGLILGFLNGILKPALKILTLPLTILTLGLFALVLNMLLVWVVDILFAELVIQGLIALFWTTLIIWGLSSSLRIFSK
ncbi:MAG: phage holin family protein [bacterium]|nr:phage holin family protein [bacterium]MDZ4231703.1 phage holin family protein [Candidatus Pacearchaeota archaeon]